MNDSIQQMGTKEWLYLITFLNPVSARLLGILIILVGLLFIDGRVIKRIREKS